MGLVVRIDENQMIIGINILKKIVEQESELFREKGDCRKVESEC